MRYNFDIHDSAGERALTPLSSSTPREELEWLPLQNHPVFSSTTIFSGAIDSNNRRLSNLLSWDGASRLYFWDSTKRCLHRISIRLGEPDPTSVLAASPTKVLQADVEVKFMVERISIKKQGSTLLLAGSDGLSVMYLHDGASSKDSNIVCRFSRSHRQLQDKRFEGVDLNESWVV